MNRSLLFAGLILIVSSVLSATPGKEFNITQYGAIGDGKTLNTKAIQETIDACNRAGGGVVTIPEGSWVTGSILLKDNVTLFVKENATLLGSLNINDYKMVDGFKDGRGSNMGYCFIGGVDVKNVSITGKGTIDGNGKLLLQQNGRSKRPFLVRFVRCSSIRVADVNMKGPAAWTMHFFECSGAVADNVTIKSRGLGNNDGIDIDGCEDVIVRNCHIDSGDDAICLKTTSSKPCKNIEVSECDLNTNQGAFKIGTESYGDFENIHFHHCRVDSTKGIKIYSVDGSNLKNLTINDILIKRTAVAMMIRLGSRLKTFHEGDLKKTVGSIESITLKNIIVQEASQIGLLISGIPGVNAKNINISAMKIGMKGNGTAEEAQTILPENESDYPEVTMFGKIMPAWGIFIRHAADIQLKQLELFTKNADGRPAIIATDLKQADINGLKFSESQPASPLIALDKCQSIKLDHLSLSQPSKTMLHLSGSETRNITIRAFSDQIQAGPEVAQKELQIIH